MTTYARTVQLDKPLLPGDTLTLTVKAPAVPPVPPSTRPFPPPTITRSVTLPSTIDLTGATDASAAINAFVSAQPSGTSIAFPPGTYRLNTGIQLGGKKHLEFLGNGAKLLCKGNPQRHQDSAFIAYSPCSDIAIRKFSIDGGNPGGLFNPTAGENLMAVNLFGGVRVEVDGLTVTNTWGDGVYLTEAVPVSGQPGIWTEDVWVHDSSFVGIGRMGIAVIMVKRLLVERCSFDRMSLDVLDIEPDLAWEGALGVKFIDNTIGTYAHYAGYTSHVFSAPGHQDAQVRDITVSRNVVTGGRQVNALNTPGGFTARAVRTGRANFVITDNRSTIAGPGPVCTLQNIAGLDIRGNLLPVTSGVPYSLNGSTGVVQ